MIRDTSAQDKLISNRGRNRRRTMMVTVATVAVGLALWFAIPRVSGLYSSDVTAAREQLRFARVERGALIEDLAVQGKVVAAISPTVYAPADGVVLLSVKAGDSVTEGQLLAQIEAPGLESLYAQENAKLEEMTVQVRRQEIQIKQSKIENRQKVELAQVDLELARRNKERAEINIKNSVVSRIDYEKDIAEFQKAEIEYKHAAEKSGLEIENLEFELQTKQLQLDQQELIVTELSRQVDQLKITSSLNGIVGSLSVHERDAVNKNDALLSLVDLSAFEVEVNIPESYADDLGVGMTTEISFNNRSYPSTLTAISPEVIDGQVNGRLRFTGDKPEDLRQNQRVAARILIQEKPDVLKVRRGAFSESGNGRIAYVVQDRLATRTDIELGVKSVSEIEVVKGLKEGDQIILSSITAFNGKDQIYITE